MLIKATISLLLSLALYRADDSESLQVDASEILTNSTVLSQAFSNFTQQFNKYYFIKAERSARKAIFRQNIADVVDINQDNSTSFMASVNKFSDLSWDEFEKTYLMQSNVTDQFKKYKTDHPNEFQAFNKAVRSRNSKSASKSSSSASSTKRLLGSTSDASRAAALVRNIDWSMYAQPVQDEASCAACYAFAAVGTFEILYGMTYGSPVKLSEQEIVDCSLKNQGCVGGYPYLVFKYINSVGLSTEEYYPFTGTNKTCTASTSRKTRVVAPVKYAFTTSILDFLEALQYGPAVGIHVATKSFKQYSSGVYDDTTCTGKLNHSAVAVGYDLDAPVPYIRFKNAWGPAWGEDGYYNLSIGSLTSTNQGTCLLASHKMNVSPYFTS